MSEQLSLMGFEPAPARDRLFLGIFPDTDTAARIAQIAESLRAQERLRGRPLATDRFHITLFHVGDYVGLNQDMVRAASEAASSIVMAPFEVTFDRAASFAKSRNRPFVLQGGDGVTALKDFRQTLGGALAKSGLGRVAKSQFTPHVTLLYDDRPVDDRAIEPVSWTVDRFVLVHSLLGQTEHRALRAWELTGAPADVGN